MNISTIRKFVIALVGAVLEALSLGLLPDSSRPWVVVAVGFLTSLGVYVAPNT